MYYYITSTFLFSGWDYMFSGELVGIILSDWLV